MLSQDEILKSLGLCVLYRQRIKEYQEFIDEFEKYMWCKAHPDKCKGGVIKQIKERLEKEGITATDSEIEQVMDKIVVGSKP